MPASLPRFVLLVLLIAASALSAAAQSTVYVVRHAERASTETDSPLSTAGRTRAEALAAVLVDAGLRHVYTTNLARTRETAAPAAQQAGVTPVEIAAKDIPAFVAGVRATLRDGEATLVVGHSNTVPALVEGLSGHKVPEFAHDEHSRLLILTLWPDGRSSVATLRYGKRP